jgi:hypothetical protein
MSAIRYAKPSIVDGGDAIVTTRGGTGHSFEAVGQKLPGGETAATAQNHSDSPQATSNIVG